MREIKFRAWDIYKKKMIFNDGFHVIGEVTSFGLINMWCMENPREGTPLIMRYNDIVVLQYTGLKDKNGKEIYEGDSDGKSIVKIGAFDQNDDWCMENICGFYIENIKTGNCMVLSPLLATRYCVSFNIYENPELLEEIK